MVNFLNYSELNFGNLKISPFNVFCVAANGELRVVRGCGWIPNEKNFEGRDCFTRTGTNKVEPSMSTHVGTACLSFC